MSQISSGGHQMILAVDVKYWEGCAVAAGVAFDDWGDEAPREVVVSFIDRPAGYQPGRFYKRELPCILKLLEEHHLRPACIVVDGYVFLDGFREPGLGKHLYDELGGAVPVIGVAKSRFRGITDEYALLRGKSGKPLYVTAVGIELEKAKTLIAGMHGDYRIPTMLKKADHACRAAGSEE